MGRGFLFCLTQRVGFHLSGGKWHTGTSGSPSSKATEGKPKTYCGYGEHYPPVLNQASGSKVTCRFPQLKWYAAGVAYMGMLSKTTQAGLPGSGMRSGEQHSPGLSPSCS